MARVRLGCRLLAVVLVWTAIEAHGLGFRAVPLVLVGIAVFLFAADLSGDILVTAEARQVRRLQRRVLQLERQLETERTRAQHFEARANYWMGCWERRRRHIGFAGRRPGPVQEYVVQVPAEPQVPEPWRALSAWQQPRELEAAR